MSGSNWLKRQTHTHNSGGYSVWLSWFTFQPRIQYDAFTDNCKAQEINDEGKKLFSNPNDSIA